MDSKLEIIYTPPSWFERLDWARVFARRAPVEVDLGCGDGGFLIESAQLRPDHNFLGVERLLGRLRKVEKRARRLGLANVRGLRIEAGYAAQWLFPDASVAVYHVLFPDPWPKRRHWRRGCFNPISFQTCTAPGAGGTLNVATDDAEYFQQMVEVCSGHARFARMPEPADAAVVTDFEREFAAAGKTILRARFQKRA